MAFFIYINYDGRNNGHFLDQLGKWIYCGAEEEIKKPGQTVIASPPWLTDKLMKTFQHKSSQNQGTKSPAHAAREAQSFGVAQFRVHKKVSFRQITSKKQDKFSTSVPFTKFVRRLSNAISDQERKTRILNALAIGDGKARKEARKVKDCRVGVRCVDGEIKPFIRSCESRWCPHCSRRNSKELQKELFRAFKCVDGFGNNNWSWLTLTLNQRNLRNRSATTAFKAIRRNLTRLFNRPEWKAVADGVYYTIEVTKPNEFYHFHAHIVINHTSSRTELNKIIKRLWVTAFAKDGAGWIYKLKKFNIKSYKSVLEITKYTAKCLDMTVSDLADIVSATIGRRLKGATGVIKETLACIRKKKEKSAEAPAPPRNFNETTGEVYSLPDGEYSYQDLLAEVVNSQSKSALYAIKLLQYRFRYGYRYEVARTASNFV